MKKFILGFIVSALLFTVIPVGAAIQEYICYKADYKVLINGEEYSHPDLPILNYKGNTYAPFRSVLEAAGLVVDWDGELRQASVITPEQNNTDEKEENNMSAPSIPNETLTHTPDNLPLYELMGNYYVSIRDFNDKYREQGYYMSIMDGRSLETCLFELIFDDDGNFIKEEVLLEFYIIPTILKGNSVFDYNLYIEQILPKIQSDLNY